MSMSKILKWLIYGIGSAYIVLFLFAATLRLMYPYEVEWNEGAVLDHAIRVLDSKPIYTASSLDFSPFVYTPLYYYVTAALMRIGGIGLWSGRLISILATLLTALIIFRIVSRESSSRLLAFSGLALYIAFYHLTGFFYDVVRMDAFAILLVAVTLYVALYARRGFMFAAILTALAYFTKQQMIFILPSIAIGLWFQDRKQAYVYTGVSVIIIVLATVIVNSITHGWFSYFTSSVPSVKASHEFSWQTLIEFYPKWMMGILGIFTFIILLGIVLRNKQSVTERVIIFGWIFAVLSSSISFANPGGYQNVLMPLMLMIAVLFPISIAKLSSAIPQWPLLAPSIQLCGFLALIYNPLGQTMLLASNRQKKAGDEFVQKLKEIPGEVLIPFHGYISSLAGKPPHVHFMAMNDALEMHDANSARLQHEIDSSLASHRFSAVILDEQKVFRWDSIPHYQSSGKIFSVPNVFLSRIGEAPTRPDILYYPKP